jgi:hypothetical protein
VGQRAWRAITEDRSECTSEEEKGKRRAAVFAEYMEKKEIIRKWRKRDVISVDVQLSRKGR